MVWPGWATITSRWLGWKGLRSRITALWLASLTTTHKSVIALDPPAVQQEFGQLLEHDARVLDRVEHATAVDGQPHADMHRVAGLAQQHGISFGGLRHHCPALSLGMVAEGGHHGAQVVGVDRDFGQFSAEMVTLDSKEQPPAVERFWSMRTGVPRPTDVVGSPVHGRS
jgi:hypothetical protein